MALVVPSQPDASSYVKTADEQTGLMRIRKRYIVLTILALPVLGFYLGCMHRFHTHAEEAGWSADFTYIACGCPFCRGRVEQFTYGGQPVPLPRLDLGHSPSFTLIAPVGHFETRAGWTEYRSHGVRMISLADGGPPVSPPALAQGHYVVDGTSGWPPTRRPGTPTHWCYATGADYCRWLDPKLIADLPWSSTTSAPSSPSP